MSNTLTFIEPEESLPDFCLVHPSGQEVHVTVLEILQCCCVSTELSKQLEEVQKLFLNRHQLSISPSICAMMMEKANDLYEDQKKTCMKQADSDDGDSTPTE